MSVQSSISANQLNRNLNRLLWMNGAWMFLLVMPVAVPWFRGHGLKMEQVYQLQAIFALIVAALELPSGYAADLLGRKNTLLLAAVIHALAFGVLAFAQGFGGFLAFEILAAIAASMWSGTDVALLYDTLDALPDSAESRSSASSFLGRKLLYSQTGETLAALLCALLSIGSLQLPVHLNAITAWLPLVLVLGLVEPPRRKMDPRSHGENLRWIRRVLFEESPFLRKILIALIAYGLATLLAVWAFQGYWQNQGISLAWFGVLWAAYNYMVAITGKVAHQIEHKISPARTLTLIAVLPVAGYLGMGLWGGLAGVLFGFLFQISRGLTQVVIKDALNSRVPTEMRATANSVSSLGVRLAFVVLGPAMGWMIDHRSYSSTFMVLSGVYSIVALVVMLPLIRELKGGTEG